MTNNCVIRDYNLTLYFLHLRDKNQIDHIVITGKWRRSLLNVSVKRGAYVESDHRLVTALI